MAVPRWLTLTVLFGLIVVVGLVSWQLWKTSDELRTNRNEVTTLKHAITRYSSSLAVAKRSLSQASSTTTTTLPSVAPFPFVDKSELLADLARPYSATTGNYFSEANPVWVSDFVNAFTAEETRETLLAEAGETYYIPDPVSEANAYAARGVLP